MPSAIENKYGVRISDWDMPLVNFDEYVNGTLVSIPCTPDAAERLKAEFMTKYVNGDNTNGIVDVDSSIDAGYTWIAFIVDSDAHVERAAQILSREVHTPTNWTTPPA